MSQLWSWGLTTIGIFGFFVTSSGRRWGWLVNVSAQALWIAYSVVTEQWGFIAASLLYAWVFFRNWRRAA